MGWSREVIDMDGIHGWGWLYAIATVALILLFWGLVISALVLGVRWLIRADRRGQGGGSPGFGGVYGGGLGPGGPGQRTDALEILRERYARGEIDDAEYERRRQVLLGPPMQPPPMQGPPPAR